MPGILSLCYRERDFTERQNMLYISTKSWSVKNLSSKSVGEAVAWFHFEARLKYKLLRQLVDFHQSRTKRPWTYRNLSRRVQNIYILALCHKKYVYFRSSRQNSESVQVKGCWEMGEVRIFFIFHGQCIAHVNSALLSYLILVTNIPLLDLIDSTFTYS